MSNTVGMAYLIALPFGTVLLWFFAVRWLPRIRILRDRRVRAVAGVLAGIFFVMMHESTSRSFKILLPIFEWVPDSLKPIPGIILVAALIISFLPPPKKYTAQKTTGPKDDAKT